MTTSILASFIYFFTSSFFLTKRAKKDMITLLSFSCPALLVSKNLLTLFGKTFRKYNLYAHHRRFY